MNNAQLDMVLGYLNEGTEIDSDEYLIESINEMINQSIAESTMITSILEEDEAPAEGEEKKDTKDKIGFGTKVKEAITRFLNWLKKLITNLKAQMVKFGQRLSGPYINSLLAKTIKKVESSKEETFNVPYGYLTTIFALSIEKKELTSTKNLDMPTEDIKNACKNVDDANAFAKLISDNIKLMKDDGDDNTDKKKIEKEYKSGDTEEISKKVLLEALNKAKNSNVSTRVEMINYLMKEYNDTYKAVASVKDGDPRAVNIVLSSLTKYFNAGLKLISGAFKLFNIVIKIANKVGVNRKEQKAEE